MSERIEYVVKDVESGRYLDIDGRKSVLTDEVMRFVDYLEAADCLDTRADRIIPVRVTTVPGKREIETHVPGPKANAWTVESVGGCSTVGTWRDKAGAPAADPVPMTWQEAQKVRDQSFDVRYLVPLRVTEGKPTVRVEEIGREPPDVSVFGQGPFRSVGRYVWRWNAYSISVARADSDAGAKAIAAALNFCDQPQNSGADAKALAQLEATDE